MRAAIFALVSALPLAAQEADLELVLLADASGSVTQMELDFQRQGYAQAITHPAVLRAIDATMTGAVAVTYIEWAANQATVVDWTLIDGPESAEAFAAALLIPPRQAYGRNAIGAALIEGMRQIERNEIRGLRRVIDFSGDSIGNFSGPSIREARAQVLAAGITINGLPILCPDCPGPSGLDLEQAYGAEIIGGPGAFVVTADRSDSFATAVRRKLILEIAGLTPGGNIPGDGVTAGSATP